ncbi:MAG: FGGY family carbohydrate kinase, partial [Planctomycetota bacterium]|nr:FGGY family carbohydrate kinase [Planctomycetota bacterium]
MVVHPDGTGAGIAAGRAVLNAASDIWAQAITAGAFHQGRITGGTRLVDFLVGLDAGTSSLKALALSADGRTLIGPVRREYPLRTAEGGIVEQDAEDWWRALCGACRELAGEVRRLGGRIAGAALSSQGGPLVCCDAGGKPLAPAISWMDTRAGAEAARIAARLPGGGFERICGWPLEAWGFPAKALWIRENDPGLWRKTGRLLSTADYLAFRLTGNFGISPSDAAMMLLLDVGSGDWSAALLDAARLDRAALSPVVESGTAMGRVSEAAAEETGLETGTVIGAGAHDQYAAALGCGAAGEGEAMLSCGTAWVLLPASGTFRQAAGSGFHPGRHVLPELYGYLHSCGGIGAVWERRVRESFDGGAPDWEAVEREVSAAAPGSGGVEVLVARRARAGPSGKGARPGAPPLRPAAAESAAGPTGRNRGPALRAAMESAAFAIRRAIGRLPELGLEVRSLRMIGGAAKSRCWPKIVADATRRPV